MKISIKSSFAILLTIAFAVSGTACKNSKKHSKSQKKVECDAECEAQKERERLEAQKNATGENGNQLGVGLTLDGQPVNGTLTMDPTDSAALVFSGNYSAANMVVGLMKGPNMGMSLISNNLQLSSLPGGSYPITILVRDRAKCQASGGADCSLPLDSQGRLVNEAQINAAFDAQFSYTVQVNGGSGGGDTGTNGDGTGTGTWNPPGFQNNNNPSFFGKVKDNMTYGVNWIWSWLKGLGNN